jgi:hypothetical protein
MQGRAPDSELIRIVVFIVVVVITLVLRVVKRKAPPQPIGKRPVPASLSTLREGMRQSAGQSGSRSTPPEQFTFGSMRSPIGFEQPKKIEPEIPVFPSLLLIALAVCLCLIAYRYFAG